MDALALAKNLSAYLLSQGEYAASPEGGGQGFSPASSGEALAFSDVSTSGFAGLSVQAVGCNFGKPENAQETVFVYAAHGTASQLSKLNRENDNIQIQFKKLPALRVRPELSSSATNRGHLFTRNGRIACGSSCAPSSTAFSGTFGAIVKRRGVQSYFVLSNNHVIGGCNHLASGTHIMSPSMSDAHPRLPAPVEIGQHAEIVELRAGNPALVPNATVDAAIALAKIDVLSSWQGDDGGYDTPNQAVAPCAGMLVKKYGRTTGYTTGIVESFIPGPHPMPYKLKDFSTTVWFKDVWIVAGLDAPFAMSGDSGSLVVTEDGKYGVGLVFATAGKYAVMAPIISVLELLNLELVGDHAI